MPDREYVQVEEESERRLKHLLRYRVSQVSWVIKRQQRRTNATPPATISARALPETRSTDAPLKAMGLPVFLLAGVVPLTGRRVVVGEAVGIAQVYVPFLSRIH